MEGSVAARSMPYASARSRSQIKRYVLSSMSCWGGSKSRGTSIAANRTGKLVPSKLRTTPRSRAYPHRNPSSFRNPVPHLQRQTRACEWRHPSSAGESIGCPVGWRTVRSQPASSLIGTAKPTVISAQGAGAAYLEIPDHNTMPGMRSVLSSLSPLSM